MGLPWDAACKALGSVQVYKTADHATNACWPCFPHRKKKKKIIKVENILSMEMSKAAFTHNISKITRATDHCVGTVPFACSESKGLSTSQICTAACQKSSSFTLSFWSSILSGSSHKIHGESMLTLSQENIRKSIHFTRGKEDSDRHSHLRSRRRIHNATSAKVHEKQISDGPLPLDHFPVPGSPPAKDISA